MTTLLDALHQLGHATWQPVWVPVLVWSVLAFPLWMFLRRTDRLHPLAEYRLSQLLLGTLPLGIAAVALVDLLPDSSPALSLPAVSVGVEPVGAPVETSTDTASLWTWTHGVGLVTTGAVAAGLLSLSRLFLDAVAVSRVYAWASRDSSGEVQTAANRLAKTLGVNRSIRAILSPKAVVPITLGGLRPTILLPADVADKKEALRMTLVHECIHIRRYDDVAHVAERAVAAVFAIHPLISRLTRHIAEARERACDAAVLDDEQTSASTYARLLASFADRPPSSRLGTLALSESESSLTTRLSAMRSSVSTFLSSSFALGASLLGLGLVLTLGVVACSDSIAPSPESPATEQSASSEAVEGEVYVVVEEQPKLIGGLKALQEDISYPELAKEAGIEGRVFVQFIVDEQGKVQSPEVTRSVHESLDEAAVEAVKQQEFEPGKQRGEPVKVQMSLPVTFKLPDEASTPEESGPTGEINTPEPPKEGPQIRGGRQALQAQLSYPDLVRKAGIEGTVRVTFTVDESGDVQQARVTKSVHDALDAAALEAVKSVSFIPTEKNGRPVSSEMTLPITFQLPDRSTTSGSSPSASASSDTGEGAPGESLTIQIQADGSMLVNGVETSESNLQEVLEERLSESDLSLKVDGDASMQQVKEVQQKIRSISRKNRYTTN